MSGVGRRRSPSSMAKNAYSADEKKRGGSRAGGPRGLSFSNNRFCKTGNQDSTHAAGRSARFTSPLATVKPLAAPLAAPGGWGGYEVGPETGGLGNRTLAKISSA